MNCKLRWLNCFVFAFPILLLASYALSQVVSPKISRDTSLGASTFDAEYRITGSRHNIRDEVDAFEFDWKRVSGNVPVRDHGNVLEAAVLSNIRVKPLQATQQNQNPSNVRSKVSVYDLDTKSIHVVYTADKLWEAPNWSPDGKYLLANSGGALYQFVLDGDEKAQPEKLRLDAGYECNNDHGITRDGSLLAFSARHSASQQSQVFVASADGVNPRLVTSNSPSYFHGWSPDGKWVAFVGNRGDHFNIFRIPVGGGNEERLTSSPTNDDGPDYSPDGKWIYINSNRSGGWDIWRFPAEGAGPNDSRAERITSDEWEDWFPHPSPDGKWMVFLSFPKGTPGHDVKTKVQLRMMPMPQAAGAVPSIQTLAQIFGGQGTINVNSWSPDSKKFAFVSYEVLP